MQDISLGSRRAKKNLGTSAIAGVADVANLDSAGRLRRRKERQHRVSGRRSIVPSAFDTSGPVEGKWRLIKRRERDRASSSAISPVCSLIRVCQS